MKKCDFCDILYDDEDLAHCAVTWEAYAIFELETIQRELEISEQPEVEQIAGRYGAIRGMQINGQTGNAHHITPYEHCGGKQI